jgi:hypothetical protein
LGRRPVRVLVKDPKKYYKLVKELRVRGVPISDLEGIEVRDSDLDGDILKAVGNLVAVSMGKEAFEEIAVGIDTNTRQWLTVAVVGDGAILEWKRTDLDNLCSYVKTVLRIYPHKREVVGVGVGNPLGLEVLNRLSSCSIEVKFVNEARTSRKTAYLDGDYPEDVIAAYNIAMRAL